MTVLGERGPQQRRFVIKLNEYKGIRLLDLRLYYLDKRSNEFRPTSKGINLNKDNYLLARRIIDEQHEAVLDWLGVGYVPENVTEYSERQQQAEEESSSALGRIVATSDKRDRDPTFFQVEHLGGTNVVNFNSSHPLYDSLCDAMGEGPAEGGGVWGLVEAMLVSFSKAVEGLSDSPATHPSILLDNLTHNWSRFLAEYLSREVGE